MQCNVLITTYIGSSTQFRLMRFTEPMTKYIIRYYHKHNKPIEWELRYYNEKTADVEKVDDTIAVLLDMTEEELFQHSCITDFDVYMVHAGMQELKNNTPTSYNSVITRKTLEY